MATVEHEPIREMNVLDEAMHKITEKHPLSEEEQQKRLAEVEDLRPSMEQGLEELYENHLSAHGATEEQPQPGIMPRRKFFELVAEQLKATSVYASAVQEGWSPAEINNVKEVRQETDKKFRLAFGIEKHEIVIVPTTGAGQTENVNRSVIQAYGGYPEPVLHAIQDMQENLIIGIRDGADQFVDGHLDLVRNYGNEQLA